ncbi:MAG: hypothetical protein RIC89_06180 [Pseudomonadales bacterium]
MPSLKVTLQSALWGALAIHGIYLYEIWLELLFSDDVIEAFMINEELSTYMATVCVGLVAGASSPWFAIPVGWMLRALKQRYRYKQMLRASELYDAGAYDEAEYQKILRELKSK